MIRRAVKNLFFRFSKRMGYWGLWCVPCFILVPKSRKHTTHERPSYLYQKCFMISVLIFRESELWRQLTLEPSYPSSGSNVLSLNRDRDRLQKYWANISTKFENQLFVVCWFTKSSIPYSKLPTNIQLNIFIFEARVGFQTLLSHWSKTTESRPG